MHKKILIVTEYFYPEEFKINEVAIAWKQKGYEVDILTQNPTYPLGKIFDGFQNRWYSKDSYNGVNIYRVKAVTGYKEILFKKLLKYFTFMILGSLVVLKIGKRYDHVLGFDVGALTGMVPAIVLQKFYKKPVTLWIQDIWPDSVYAYGFKKTKLLEFFLNGFVKFVYKNTSNFAISAKGFENKIKPYLSEAKEIKYVPNWADEFDKSLEPFEFSINKKLHFTFAGNIGKMQNLDNIILAFGSLSVDFQQKVQLNIVGDGSYVEFLQNLVLTHSIENVVFWGRQPRKDMHKYFLASDFLIVSLIDKPIFTLTVPSKMQTYIAAHKPILAIIKGEAAQIVEENNLGYTANPNDIDEIRNIFKKAINSNKDETMQFTQSCEYLTNTIFNKEKIIDSLLNLTTKNNLDK